ncbi:hypothetical protein FRB90_003243 [Tulasnella sp. 427]|nr:hypothetical protein FRB90_003243 [Tulasnella sp. 427]
MPSSSSLTSPEASKLIALASPSFIALFLLPYTFTLSLRLTPALHHPPRSTFRIPFYPRPTFILPALASFLYGIGGLCSLLSLPRYVDGASQSSLERGAITAQGVTQTIGRLGVTALALYLAASNSSTARTHRVLSIIHLSFLLATLLIIALTFTLLSVLFSFADALSHHDPELDHSDSTSGCFEACNYGARSASIVTFPPPRMLRHIHYSKTISHNVPRILIVTLLGVLGAALRLGNILLNHEILDVTHIGLTIGSALSETLWVAGVVNIFYDLCTPHPKVHHIHIDAEEGPSSSANPHLPTSSSGNRLRPAYPAYLATPPSPLSPSCHEEASSASTTLPHTPVTPNISVPTPKAPSVLDGLSPSSTESAGSLHRHLIDQRAATTATAPGVVHPGADIGGHSVTQLANLSEELLILRTPDPFSSPPPGTVVLPRVSPSSSASRKKRKAVTSSTKSGGASGAPNPATTPPRAKVRPKRSVSTEVLSDGWKGMDVQELQPGITTTASPPEDPAPSSKRARTTSESAQGSSKPSKRSPSKPIFSRRSSSKRRLARQGRTNWPEAVDATNAAPLNRAPSLVPGTTRPRPHRSPIPEQHRFNDSFPTHPANPHADLVGLHPIAPDGQQISIGTRDQRPPAQTEMEMKEELLTSVVTNALLLDHLNQQIAYRHPATALTLPQNANQQAHTTSEEGNSPSGSITPRPPSGGENDEVTPRCVTPAVADSTFANSKEDFNAEPSNSTDAGPQIAFSGHQLGQSPVQRLLEPIDIVPPPRRFISFDASLPSASEIQNMPTPSPYLQALHNMRTVNPPSSFEPSAPIDIPAARRNHHRRTPTTSILDVGKIRVESPSEMSRRMRMHRGSSSYDDARARSTHGSGANVGRNLNGSLARLWSTRLLRNPGASNSAPQIPALKSRFSDTTASGTVSSGGMTSSPGGVDAGSESSYK